MFGVRNSDIILSNNLTEGDKQLVKLLPLHRYPERKIDEVCRSRKKVKSMGAMETIKVKAFVERSKNGTYSVYMDHNENRLNYGVIGEGKSAEDAIKDFFCCYADIKQSFEEDGESFTEVEFNIEYDIASFLNYYSNILTLSGLETITGINQRQLGHYVQGRTRPSPNTVRKIEHSLHNLSAELGQVRFSVSHL